MLKNIILVVCIVLASSAVRAGTQEHRALAQELIMITEGNTVLDKMKAQMTMIFQQIVTQMNVPEADKPKLEKYTKRFQSILAEDMAWDKIREQYLDLYTSVFTEEETRGLVDFYKSDLGKKVTAKMPELLHQNQIVARTYMQTVVPKLETLFEEMRTEISPGHAEEGNGSLSGDPAPADSPDK